MTIMNEGEGKPEISIIMPIKDSEQFIEEAVSSVLNQKDVIAEIIISDDKSEDNTYKIAKKTIEKWKGKHRVELLRNKKSLGIDHFTKLAEQASAPITVMAHGDDIQEPNRCKRILDTFKSTKAYVIGTNAEEIDEHGNKKGLYVKNHPTGFISEQEFFKELWFNGMVGACLAWRKEAYSLFPRLDSKRLPLGHDSVKPFRGILLGGFMYLDEPLIQYRRHIGEWSWKIHANTNKEILQEASEAHAASVRFAMIKDVQHLINSKNKVLRERAKKIQPLLEKKTFEICEQWIGHRDQMHRDGWRAEWIPAEEAENIRVKNQENKNKIYNKVLRKILRK